MAAGGGGDALFFFFRPLRQQLQRILPAAYDRALAADFARHFDRISQPREEQSVGSVMGFRVLRFKLVAGRILWRRSRQCSSWSSARRQRVFLRTAVDEFSARR